MTADLTRFTTAQSGGVYERALAEVRRGAKSGHWMWFVFPQIAGLGRSATARHYAIADLAEARAYLADPELGARLREISAAADAAGEALGEHADAERIFGEIDAMKLRSSMTLFQAADPAEPVFGRVLERFFGGRPDEATLRIIGR